MKVEYEENIVDKVMAVIYEAKRSNTIIKKILLTKAEWEQLCNWRYPEHQLNKYPEMLELHTSWLNAILIPRSSRMKIGGVLIEVGL